VGGRAVSSLLIRGGLVVDGTGAPGCRADVLVEGGRISWVDTALPGGNADDVVDADGLVVAPGFIDVHSHADNAPLLHDLDFSKLSQGVTTEVVGNCGFSLAPCSPSHRDDLASLTGRIFPALDFAWEDTSSFFDRTDSAGYVVNAAPLVGHGALRVAAMGLENRSPTPAELAHMRNGLAEALEAGVFGMSSGLIYPPGTFSATEELVVLAGDLPIDRVYATHVRGEGRRLLASLDEAITIAEASGCRLQVSHLKAVGAAQWGSLPSAVERLDAAHERGVVVHHDVYPYEAASTMLTACLPPWFQEGGEEAMLRRLHDDEALARAMRELAVDDGSWENWVAACGWSRVVIASTASHRHEGMDLARVAAERACSPFQALVDVLREERLQAAMVVFAMSEADVRVAFAHPRAMVGTDGLPPGRGGKPHPRAWGTFPRVLARYVREEALLTLPEAIRKMTSLPADAFGIPDRGVVASGRVADLVLFDASSVADRATYAQPHLPAAGVEMVLLAGTVALAGGRATGVRAGRRLRPAGVTR